MIDRINALQSAIRLFDATLPEAEVRCVDARLVLKHWIVNFEKKLPVNVVESPGSWCIEVDAETGNASWFTKL